MVHVFVFVEGRKTWFDLFLSDLNKRRYEYRTINGGTSFIQPNSREIHLMDISIPKDAVPQLLSDLAPFAYRMDDTVSDQKDKAEMLAKGIRVAGGFKPIYPEFDKPVFVKDIIVIEPNVLKLVKRIERILVLGWFVKRKRKKLWALWKDRKVIEVPYIGRYLDMAFRFLRAEKPLEEYKSSGELRHKWINVMPIGIKDDWCHPESEIGGLPAGGELI